MDWRKEFANKIVSAEEAVSHIQSGDNIVFTHACGESQILTNELVNQADRLKDVVIMHMVAMGKAPYCQPGMESHLDIMLCLLGDLPVKLLNLDKLITHHAFP